MTAPQSADSPDTGTDNRDVVGSRVLIGIQMINISRLSTDPVPLVPKSLITIAGQGPVDSNGAGKSSLIAAISLMHADEQWRLNSGAKAAADMLFTARDAGGGDWSNADHGYVIGVFADADATEPHELEATALTVWIRINRESPHLALRWHDGLWLPRGNTDAHRAEQADPMWTRLTKRNGRKDIGATGMTAALFGEHVRCVSFLSTTVRASKTTNLLAQPLNDITPDRIFDAITTLTGLDNELEREQQQRAAQYELQQKEQRTRQKLEEWETEARIQEAAIERRQQARDTVERARAAWRNRLAHRVVNAMRRKRDIDAEQREIDTAVRKETEDDETLARQVRELENDQGLAEQLQRATAERDRLAEQEKDLEGQKKLAASDTERLRAEQREAQDQARLADGRDEATARSELTAAGQERTDAHEQRGVVREKNTEAQEELRAAEQGGDLAPRQIAALTSDGHSAAALLDLVVLTDAERAEWEPLLWPYRDAVVTQSPLEQAAQSVAALPGSMLVRADEQETGSAELPATDGRMSVTGFLRALRQRHDIHTNPTGTLDPVPGVLTVGEFTDPVTGRASRIERARAAAETTATSLKQVQERVDRAEATVQLAKTRLSAAQAALTAQELDRQAREQSDQVNALAEQLAQLEPELKRARDEHETLRDKQTQRETELNRLKHEREGTQARLKELSRRSEALAGEERQLDIESRLEQWQGTEQEACDHLETLPDDDRGLDEHDWMEEARKLVDEADTQCFPRDTVSEIPGQIRELRTEIRQGRGKERDARFQTVFPRYLRALRQHLSEMEKFDTERRAQIGSERQRRTRALEVAGRALHEQRNTTELVRGQLRDAIKKRLNTVSEHFNDLDRAYSGHGAILECPEPEPPADPTQMWGWQVTPKWRRSEEHDTMIAYHARANTAQLDEKAVKLVCAAALASSSGRGMVLVLDELGRNLGAQHRKDAVELFQSIGTRHGITVLGALQDDMERYAIHASGEYIKLRRTSDSRPYNNPPVVIGQETNTARIEMLRNWLTEHRNDADNDSECGT